MGYSLASPINALMIVQIFFILSCLPFDQKATILNVTLYSKRWIVDSCSHNYEHAIYTIIKDRLYEACVHFLHIINKDIQIPGFNSFKNTSFFSKKQFFSMIIMQLSTLVLKEDNSLHYFKHLSRVTLHVKLLLADIKLSLIT